MTVLTRCIKKKQMRHSELFVKQLLSYQNLLTKEGSTLFAKIRSGRFHRFRSGSIVNFVLPENRNCYGVVKTETVITPVLLVKKLSKQEKYQWYERMGISPANDPGFFSQHFWLSLHGEEALLVMEGFLEPVNMEELEEEKTDELHTQEQ